MYTSWKKMGVRLVVQAIESKVDSFAIIDGSVSARDRTDIVDRYNNNEIQCLIFTAAGAEGISLTSTSYVVLFDAAWTGARLEQALARAIRARSHDAWPPEERRVHVYQLILRRNARTDAQMTAIVEERELDEKLLEDLSADERLCRYVAEKDQKVDCALKVLRESVPV